jgi:hypothetical protein
MGTKKKKLSHDIHIKVSLETRDEIEAIAESKGMYMSDLIRAVLFELVEKEKRKVK